MPSGSTMKGVAVTQGSVGVGQLQSSMQVHEDLPAPTAVGAKKVIVKVLRSAISIDDIHGAEGSFLGYISGQPKKISKKTPLIPGYECCGVIVKRGEKVPAEFKVGDVVLGFTLPTMKVPGAWAEFAELPADMLVHKPAEMTPDEAVASYVSGLVGLIAVNLAEAVVKNTSKPRIVVCGSTGSIGTLVLGVLRASYPEGDLVAICSSRTKQVALDAGASRVVQYDSSPDWGKELKGSANVVIDLVGGSETERMGGVALRRGGRFVTMVGPIKYLGDKKRSLLGFLTWFATIGLKMANPFRKHSYRLGDIGSGGSKVLPRWKELAAAKVLQPHVERTANLFDIADLRDAMALVKSHRAKGKVVVHVSDDHK